MATQGNTTVNFGSFPGASDASAAVTGQAGIVAGSAVEAWIRCEASADHSSDEHMLESIKCVAKDIIPGTGFTVHCFNTSELSEPLEKRGRDPFHGLAAAAVGAPQGEVGGKGTRLYGAFNISWVWN